MIFQNDHITVSQLDDGMAELVFNAQGDSVNKFDQATVKSLSDALDALESQNDIRGLLVSSAKPVFIVGADIAEFTDVFKLPAAQAAASLIPNNKNFNRFSALPFPTCVAINGFALGGGFEFCLACDFRIMSSEAVVGLPETSLGILPGWGGTARLPRIIGVEQSIDWITQAKTISAKEALAAGAVDAEVEPEALREAALQKLQQAAAGDETVSRRAQKSSPMQNVDAAIFTAAKAEVAKKVDPNLPAPLKVVEVIEHAHVLELEAALAAEAEGFAELAVGDVATALVGMFLSDQLLKKKARNWEKRLDKPLEKGAVLGAGIMGGGIAYVSALKGIPVRMKDIAQEGLDLGLSEASKLMSKRVKRGRMTQEKMDKVLASIEPQLDYANFSDVDIVVEAVIENVKVKQAVLSEVEKEIRDDAVLATNTSTMPIGMLAESLQRPENFCGMHFFNPVHAMPLVEVIRGEKTSDAAVAKTVAYANKMGKKAIVVRDCPGFLVNRTFFPYIDGFSKLLNDGADFQQVDQVMERWGWPMGPAYLSDVIGIDTLVFCVGVMAEGFPDRMKQDFKSGLHVMYEAGRYGQKNQKGFYEYGRDENGRPTKSATDTVYELLASEVAERQSFNDDEIVARTLLPMCTEMARCLEEGIVESAAEADLSLVYGLGFPAFRGGVFRWMDAMGMEYIAKMSERFASLGKVYELTEGMRAKLADGSRYYD